MRETYIEKTVCSHARSAGLLAVKFKNPVERGWPDRIFFGPGGFTFFIEFKAPDKVPNPLQLATHERLRRLGFGVFVVDNVDAGRKLIDLIVKGREGFATTDLN